MMLLFSVKKMKSIVTMVDSAFPVMSSGNSYLNTVS